jgi:hypothetical protein
VVVVVVSSRGIEGDGVVVWSHDVRWGQVKGSLVLRQSHIVRVSEAEIGHFPIIDLIRGRLVT